MSRMRWILNVVFALVATGCASTSPPPPADVQEPAYTLTSEEYRIGVDDRLQVTVWRNPDLSVTAPVRPDGRFSVPLIGDVEAGGHTPAEVADMIKTRLAIYIRDPQVVVIVTELRSHEFLTRVRVTGAVRTPRSMPHRQGMTVLDAVLEAGGPTDFAAANDTKLYRNVKGQREVIAIRLDDILRKGRLESNVPLRPGDVITVPEKLF